MWAPRPKWAPSVTAYLVCNAVKETVAVFIDPSWDMIQRRICFFGASAKRWSQNGVRTIIIILQRTKWTLQCDKLQRDDLHHYRQPLQERRRGHDNTGNVPAINRFREVKALKKLRTCKKEMSDTSLCLFCSDICIPTGENAKAGCIAGSVARWTHHACAGFMCEICTND